VREVDFLRLFGENLNSATGVLVALLEGLEGSSSLATETEALSYLCPVELECCTSLCERDVSWVSWKEVRSSGEFGCATSSWCL
jgi:hypothetical protein